MTVLGLGLGLGRRRSVADGEAASYEPRLFHLVDEGDGGVFHGDAAEPVGFADRLAAADPEPAGSFTGGYVSAGLKQVQNRLDVRRAFSGPSPARRA